MLQRLTTAAVTLMDKYEMLSESFGEPDTGLANKVSAVENSVPNLAYPGDRCCTFYDYRDYGGD